MLIFKQLFIFFKVHSSIWQFFVMELPKLQGGIIDKIGAMFRSFFRLPLPVRSFSIRILLFGYLELDHPLSTLSSNCPIRLVITTMKQCASKYVNNCLNTNIYSYVEASGGQSSHLYLNVVHFFQHQC